MGSWWRGVGIRIFLCIVALSLSITGRPCVPVGSANDGQSQTGTNMSETYFSASKMLGHLRGGPSGPYLDGFAAALERQGYSADTAVRYLRAAAHLGHVVARQKAMLSDIDLQAFSEPAECELTQAGAIASE